MPLAARAQQRAMPVIGYLDSGSADTSVGDLAAFREGLRASGYEEGQNVAIEYRWGDDHNDRLPSLQRNWFAVGLPCLPRSALFQSRSRRRLQPQQYRSSLRLGRTRLRQGWSRASVGQAVTSRGRPGCRWNWLRND